jgi:hypothetical protein
MQNNVYWSFVLNRELNLEWQLTIFQASEDIATGEYTCLVPGCDGGAHMVKLMVEKKQWIDIMLHFQWLWRDAACILWWQMVHSTWRCFLVA